jgi:hypothetical protein
MRLKDGFRGVSAILVAVLAGTSAQAGVLQTLFHCHCPAPIPGDTFGYHPTLWSPWPIGPEHPGLRPGAGPMLPSPAVVGPEASPAKPHEEMIPTAPRPVPPAKEP